MASWKSREYPETGPQTHRTGMGRVQSEVMDVGEPWGPEGCRGGIIIDYIRERESELYHFVVNLRVFL